jgi:serine/threonine-protein kinase
MDSSIVTLSGLRASPERQARLERGCQPGQVFRGRYQVMRTLGRGGFGVTFLAKDISLPYTPLCVIKQLFPKTNNPAVLAKAEERFEREAKTLSQLGSHSQIPRLLDYFRIEDEFYLVQEYVKGNTLTKEVQKKGPLSEDAVKRFLRELLPVVGFIHQQQVIHRDIKPPNIIRCQDDNRLVLIDFGAVKEEIAQMSDAVEVKASTTSFIGTVGFAPPEQLSLRPIYASDIYAIGMTCLFLLTGNAPLAFDVNPRTGEVDWQSVVQVSSHFGKILTKMLRISPCDRYQSVDQVLRALDLEPHIDQLSDCMHTITAPMDATVENADAYLPPMARKAAAIRALQDRLRQRQIPPSDPLGNGMGTVG